MIFVDEATISVRAGDGGKGCESFYRDKFMRYPRPDGGDGGRGGDITFIADKRIHTLLDFRFRQHFQADKGGNASSKNKQGKDAKHCFLKVPLGTIIRDHETGLLIKDLVSDQQTVTVVKGGNGGRGNGNKRPPTQPQKGEERKVHLELKIVADVGIIGFPNAGKSTLITNISRAKSKIANYPFTTRAPILGRVSVDDVDFVVADLPGIIEGAHEGKGLGDRFLRHAERTKILMHLIDMAGSEDRDPLEDYQKINFELAQYSDNLFYKHKILVANKMDLPEAAKNLKRFKRKYKEPILAISCVDRIGIDELLQTLKETICKENSPDPSSA